MNNNNAAMLPVAAGFYQHYKGQYYQVLAVTYHSEENAPYVLYRALYGEFRLWVRPLSMFSEIVEHQGKRRPRFDYLGAQPPADCSLPPAWLHSGEQQAALWQGEQPALS